MSEPWFRTCEERAGLGSNRVLLEASPLLELVDAIRTNVTNPWLAIGVMSRPLRCAPVCHPSR